MLQDYLPFFVHLALALAVPILLTVMIAVLSKTRRHPNPDKYLSYESGHPTPPLSGRFPVKFYLLAMLFVVLDVEAAAFYPWAVLLQDLKLFGLLEMAAFLLALAIGYAYVWKKGGLQWK